MIISEIKVLTSSVQDIFGTITGVITLSSNSRSDKTIISTKWTTDILSGTANNLYPDTGGTFIPLIENQDLTLFFSWINIENIAVTLTVTDEEGKESTSSIWIANDMTYPNPDYWLFYGIKIDEVILPNGLVEFTPSPFVIDLLTSTDISDISTFDVFTFDKYNNGIDITNSSINPTTFQGIYTELFTFNTTKLTNTNFTGGYPIDLQSYVIPMFNPTILNAKDLILTNINDECSSISAYSEIKSYIDKLSGRTNNNTMSELRVELITNCCEKNTYSLAPHYNFDLSISGCTAVITPPTQATINGNLYDIYTYTLTIAGISNTVVSSITVSDISNTFVITNPTTMTITGLKYYIPVGLLPQYDAAFNIIVMNIAGHSYSFDYTVSGDSLLSCSDRLLDLDITYPELPCGIEIVENTDNTSLLFNSTAYGETSCSMEDTLTDGIYQVNLLYNNLNNERISNCIFIDCDTYCKVVKALSMECNPIIQILYDSLKYMDNCDILTCQNKCDTYETLVNYLKECDCTLFENNVVKKKGCGCNK